MDHSFSIIITARRLEEIVSLDELKRLDYPGELYEVIAVTGGNPSVQRNAGVENSTGDIILFLDNDSIPGRDILRTYSGIFRERKAAGAGGPSCLPEDASLKERIFQWVLGSSVVVSNVSYRYSKKGTLSPSEDSRLILCNLALDRRIFNGLGGFNPRLYPNEENELISRAISRGNVFYRVPSAVVYRHQRSSFPEFARMLFRYGRGRSQQTRISPSHSNFFMFLPIILILYLFSLPFFRFGYIHLPLVAYMLLYFINSIAIAWREKNLISFGLITVASYFVHISYSLGVIWGFFKPFRRKGRGSASVIQLKEFTGGWKD